MVLSNGSVGAKGKTELTYSIENVKRDEVLQCGDKVALPPDGKLKSVFFSENGDPVIFDSEGVLLILQHWRSPGQARWVPLLDTKQLERPGGSDEEYWPVAVAQDIFHCIILKRGEKHPYFPRPLLSEFEFQIPLTGTPVDGKNSNPLHTAQVHEETVVRKSVFLSLLEDSVGTRPATSGEGHQKAQYENAIDKALLWLLAIECGNDHGEKALELCGLFRQPRTLDSAVKIAVKYQRGVLAEKIGKLRENSDLDMSMEF